MRKRRAIVFDDEVLVLNIFKEIFAMKDYEVLTFAEPVVCPIYDQHSDVCVNGFPCADVIITDFNMPRMNGLELLIKQSQKGCRLTIENKAVISGYLADDKQKVIEGLGYKFFKKPVRISDLSAWLAECEKRIDLSQPLGTRRKEKRQTVLHEVAYRTPHSDNIASGVAVNMSDSGLCLKINSPVAVEQIVHFDTGLPNSCRTAFVRWVRKNGDGTYLAGLNCSGM